MKGKFLPSQNSKDSCTAHSGRTPGTQTWKTMRYLMLLIAVIMLISFPGISQTITIDGNPSDWPAVLTNQPIATFVKDKPQNNDNQFTSGTKDYDLASGMLWSYSPVGDKVNLVNGGAAIIDGWLYFFGDRTSSLGSAQIGFWVFQNGTSPNETNFGFSPEKTPGDLLILSEFTNGGGVATIKAYRWLGSGSGVNRLQEIPLTQAQALAMVSANSSGFPVPTYPDWEYCNKEKKDCGFYYQGTFFEGKVDLTGLLTPEQLCNATFLLETRQSFSLNSMLGDFIAGSFNISPDPPALQAAHSCEPGALVTLSVINPKPSETYKWYSNAALTNLVHTGTSYSFNITQNTTFWVTGSEGSCEGKPSQVTATVTQLSCSIINYTAPVFGQSAGSATVQVLVNGQPSNLPYTIHWSHDGSSSNTVSNLTNAGTTVTVTLGNCTTTCGIPAAQGCPDLSYNLGCNPVLPNSARVKADLEAHYGQGSVITITSFSAGSVVSEGCLRSQVVTVSYQDQIGNVESGCTVTYTWKEDTTAPEITTTGQDGDLGCNPSADAINAALGSATANDGCDGSVNVSTSTAPVVENGCYRSQTRTFTATDACGNSASKSVTASWKVDTEGPSLQGELTNLQFVCDQDVVLPNPQFTDNCGGAITVTYAINGSAVTAQELAAYVFPQGNTQVCYTAVDECGNPTEACIIITVAPCEESCETAFGKGATASCFLPEFSRWGWTNLITPGSYSFELWAAAGQCDTNKGTLVGSVDVVYANGHVTVTYNVIPPYRLDATHTYVGTTKYPQVKKGRTTTSTVAPGSYYYAGPFNGGPVYVIAHAVVCGQFGTPVVEESVVEKSAVIERLDNASELRVYPNPFNSRVAFEFVSDKNANARLEIYNNVGQRITTLFDKPVERGVLNRVEYTPVNVTHGVLFYRLQLDDEVQNGKLLYTK